MNSVTFVAPRLFMRALPLFALAVLAACSSRTDRETAVRRVLEQAEAAAEARDVREALALVSADYSDRAGRDRDALRNVVRGYFALNPSLELLLRVESLEFPEVNRARVRLQVASGGRAAEGAETRFDVDLGRFDLDFVDESGDWRLLRAERVDGAAF